MFKNLPAGLVAIAASAGISVANRRLRRLADPRLNRWTGEPHQHRREIARRQRQAGA